MVRERERVFSCSFLSARFAEERGARFGRRALKRRGNQTRRRARERRAALLCNQDWRPGRALGRLRNSALSDSCRGGASDLRCGGCSFG